jgi:hypothetical protein
VGRVGNHSWRPCWSGTTKNENGGGGGELQSSRWRCEADLILAPLSPSGNLARDVVLEQRSGASAAKVESS